MNRPLLMSVLTFAVFSLVAEQNVTFGVASSQNKRPYQEDRFTCQALYQGHFFGIYDGHGGYNTSSFLQDDLHNYLVGPFFTMKDACKTAFKKAEAHALEYYKDGSTALMMFIDHNNIVHCAWVGDSRMVLEKKGMVDFETTDHKPDNSQELPRIESCGGSVYKNGVWRVGGLAVSRSIGDAFLKQEYSNQIIAEPDYIKISLTHDHHFAIMASDGLWDVIDSSAAVELVKTAITTQTPQEVACLLVDEAIVRGSLDNITVCIVCLNA